MALNNPHDTSSAMKVGAQEYQVFSLKKLPNAAALEKLPISLKVLLENLLRNDDGSEISRASIRALAAWDATKTPDTEIAFTPARVLLQDFTGVPCVVDLAAMRDAMEKIGGDPKRINPLQPVDLVIDHSVQIDAFASHQAFAINSKLEYERNQERYAFLRWGATAFNNFRVVPPDTGIVHQINLEYLASVVFTRNVGEKLQAYPDTLVGTDSHTPMVNSLGVLGWGVGGIEAEAAMLGQPISMLIPQVIGVRLVGKLLPGATATDLVLTVTEMLRKRGVVGRFVEYFGSGLSQLPVADRATIANMAPEYGATVGFFPVDQKTLEYLRFTGRSDEQIALVERYCRDQGMFREDNGIDPTFTDVMELDLGSIEPSLAGPKRPQDRIPLRRAKKAFRESLVEFLQQKEQLPEETVKAWLNETKASASGDGVLHKRARVQRAGQTFDVTHGNVAIASITSCTNTSNPSILVAAGLLARNAAQRGLKSKPWVKTSFAPGSKAVREYLMATNLLLPLEELGFHIVGYGCTTCIGNSGPLPEEVAEAVTRNDLVVAAVLSGNRNFEGRINPLVRANYLASPPLVVAYALAGTMNIDLINEPLGIGSDGKPVTLAHIWPSPDEIQEYVQTFVKSEAFKSSYADVFTGDSVWRSLPVPTGDRFQWEESSTYIKEPPFFENLSREPGGLSDIKAARCIAVLGHSVTTDHISPAGNIALNSPAGKYLIEKGVEPKDFNSYGARRGNHEVMMRGTFANIRLRNQMASGTEGGWTTHLPDREVMTIYDAAMRYAQEGVALIVIAGKEYGSGSSRDWAAKGTRLLGIRAVIAESFERIHRSNLVGMGVLPLQFLEGEDRTTLGLSGNEEFQISGIAHNLRPGKKLDVKARRDDGSMVDFEVLCRIDTPNEVEYFRHGGILPFVLRMLAKKETAA